tara:strand:+ start:5007 stop:5303 length:297 start_codon:yes stop_codon:yes gene_type:complete
MGAAKKWIVERIKKPTRKSIYKNGGSVLVAEPPMKGKATSLTLTINHQAYYSRALSELLRTKGSILKSIALDESMILSGELISGFKFKTMVYSVTYNG